MGLGLRAGEPRRAVCTARKKVVSKQIKRLIVGGITDLDQTNHFLVSDESLEAAPWLSGVILEDDGARALPTDTVSVGKQVFHQGSLAGQLKLDRTITQAVLATAGDDFVVLLDSLDGVLHSHKLNVAVIGLAGNAFHDDVNGLLAVVQDARVATEESDNLCTAGSERNLYQRELSVASCRKEEGAGR